MSRQVFVDTSFFVGLLWPRDQYHAQAMQAARTLEAASLVTTNLVRGETWTVLRRRAGHRHAVEFLDALASSGRYQLTHLPEALEREALEWLRRHDEREYSFVDATSFAFMRLHAITDALAFDGDFSAAGFVELRR